MQAFGILVRLWIWALALRALKHVLPLPQLVRLVQTRASRTPRSAAFERRLESYLERRQRFPFRAPGNCLERSLGAYRILCAAGAQPELVIGVRRGADGRVAGHVWTRTAAGPLGETDSSLAGFAVLATFDASASRGVASTAIPTLRFR